MARTDRDLPFFAGDDNPNLVLLRDILLTHTVLDAELGLFRHDMCPQCMHYHASCTAGYVQGMTDLLAPILMVVGTEVEAFWCFASYMKRMVGFLLFEPALLPHTLDVESQRNNFINITMSDGLASLRSLTKYVDPELFEHLRLSLLMRSPTDID